MDANADGELLNLSKQLKRCILFTAVCPDFASSFHNHFLTADCVGRSKLGAEQCELIRGSMRAKRR